MKMTANSGKVDIRGKEYKTVALRVSEFRGEYGTEYSIRTEVVSSGDVVVVKAEIINAAERVVATGYAEEVRDSSNINRTSALENCETSAVGRALAFFGYAGSEIASADEVNSAIIAEAKKEVSDYFLKYNTFVRNNLDLIFDIKEAVSNQDYTILAGLWIDLPEEDQKLLYCLAPTKGGILTTEERAALKSDEFSQAAKLIRTGD